MKKTVKELREEYVETVKYLETNLAGHLNCPSNTALVLMEIAYGPVSQQSDDEIDDE